MNKRIVLTGPESTGKSRITAYLADRFRLPAAQEYARIYLEKNGPAYDYDLLLQLSRLHKKHQDEQVSDVAPLGIFDTDLINYKIWCEVVYGKCHPEIITAMEAETHHVYLLCYFDIPWEYDPLREHRSDRPKLFERHKQEIERLGRPYIVITGLGEERFEKSALAMEKLIKTS